VIFGVLRHPGGRIAEENFWRSPVSGSVRRSLTRGTVTCTAPALVGTSRGWWLPLRTTRRRPFSSRSPVVAGDVVVDLGLQGLGEYPPNALADELVDQGRPARARPIGVGSSRNYGEHGSYLPDRRWRAGLA